MIRELVNFMNEISQSNPQIFSINREPSEGLHLFIELDEEGKWKNKPPRYKVDYDYYDGKNDTDELLSEIIKYEDCGRRVGTTMNKVFDKKKQIFSCSPFIVTFKKKSFQNSKLEGIGTDKVTSLFSYYFENARAICLNDNDEISIQKSKAFEQVCYEVLTNINDFLIPEKQKDGSELEVTIFDKMKDSFFVNIYLKDVPLTKYKEAHANYLKQNLFNKNDYNSEEEITDATYGLSNFLNGLNAKKPFLEHKTASMYKGISGRITAEDALALSNFETLLSNKILPNPLPVFIDKKEFATNLEIIRIYNETKDGKPAYSEILKEVCGERNRNLANYYLLFMLNGEVKDFDFVSLFRYKMEKNGHPCEVLNLFGSTSGKQPESTMEIHTIFGFESNIVQTVFNNSLVKIKDNKMSVNYFNEIDPQYVSGKDIVYQMIMKYRQAFYDYIYKSKEDAITCLMFDDIMYHVIIADMRQDEFKEGKYHSKENDIKKKLNIWFSLYNYFDTNNPKNKNNMASKIKELMNHVRSVANNHEVELSSDPAEFAFAAGQVIYYLLTKSAASNKTYAMLEPILQKHSIAQVQDAITEMISMYKHEIDLGKGRFANLAKDVLTYEGNEDMKKYQRFLLAGCFAPNIIYEKKNDENTKSE
ncbi:hypothetical protein [Limibacterium fermenti]|uniref:hypothetical protein n=1 Tax=Limibacterium fermenti TaxID=3229863 RepID=UPI003A67BD77